MQNEPKSINNMNAPAGKIAYALITLMLIGAFLAIFQLNDNVDAFSGSEYSEWSTHYIDTDQYALLADAILDGSFTLDLPVPDELAGLESPYRIEDRMAIASPDVPIYWDHAFYQGNYYSYFGIVPAVLLFAPYKLVTGSWLYTPLAIKIIGVLAIVALSLMTWCLGRRYFQSTATVLSLGACLFALYVGCNFAYHAFVPRFYSVPIVSSLLFTALGLWLWMSAAPERKTASSFDDPRKRRRARSARGRHARTATASAEGAIALDTASTIGTSGAEAASSSTLSTWRLVAGSACMALNLGCRPQFILASLLAFAIFKREIFETRELFSREGLAKTIAALVPFAVIFAPLLTYNYARFGSVFDFGSSYNLTGFDMTEYSMSRLLTIVLMATYLFGPMSFSSTFPFVNMTSTDHPQWGWAPNEPFYGGFFLLMPVQILALLVPFVRRTLKRRGLTGFVVLCFALSLVILLVDTRIAGITQRYFSDFGIYIALVASIVLLSFQAQGIESRPLRALAIVALAIAVLFTIVVGTFSLFSPDRYDAVITNNPALYSTLQSFFS